MNWLSNLFWQRANTEDLRQVKEEVANIKTDVATIKTELAEAVEAFRKLAGDKP